MSVNIQVALEQVWSINDQGYFELELLTLPSLGDEVVGPLVLSTEVVLANLNKEILAASDYDLQFDPSDWLQLADKLQDMGYLIEQKIEALHD